MDVPIIGAVLCGFYIRAPDFCKLPDVANSRVSLSNIGRRAVQARNLWRPLGGSGSMGFRVQSSQIIVSLDGESSNVDDDKLNDSSAGDKRNSW